MGDEDFSFWGELGKMDGCAGADTREEEQAWVMDHV